MERDKLKGEFKQVKGHVREEAGRMSGDTSEELKGAGERVAGKAQEGYGRMKEKVKNDLRGSKQEREEQREKRGIDEDL